MSESNQHQYRFLGDLYLPDPASFLGPLETQRLQFLRPLLDEFEREIVHPTLNTNDAFEQFASREILTHSSPQSKELLVRPSGSLLAKLAIHLHWPSYSDKKLLNTSIAADPGSPCPDMLRHAGFTPEYCFWFNEFSRREKIGPGKKFNPAKAHSSGAIACHREWAQTLRDSMRAKIELVFGKENREHIISTSQQVLEEFVLWDEFKTHIWFEFSSVSKTKIRRILLFLHHPQHYFHNKEMEAAEKIDAQLKIAAFMAKVPRSSRQEGFFKWKAAEHAKKAIEIKESGKTPRKTQIAASETKRKRELFNENSILIRKQRGIWSKESLRLLEFPGDHLHVKCMNCGLEAIDVDPVFWRPDNRFYVALAGPYCKGYHPSFSLYIPVDGRIPWFSTGKAELNSSVEKVLNIYNKWVEEELSKLPPEEFLDPAEIGADDEFREQDERWFFDEDLYQMVSEHEANQEIITLHQGILKHPLGFE